MTDQEQADGGKDVAEVVKRESYSSVTSRLGRRFAAACRRRKISKAEAARQMGYAYYTSLAAVLSGMPGKCGPKSLARIEAWLEKKQP